MKEKEEKARYTPQHIANFFLNKRNHDIDNLKLNKLVFISYGWGLAYNMELFDEPIQAWEFGPVIPSIYHEFKKYGPKKITSKSIIFDFLNNKNIKPIVKDRDVEGLLNSVYRGYGHFSSIDLVNITHKKGSPWEQTYQEDNYNLPITRNSIKEYYSKLREINEKNSK